MNFSPQAQETDGEATNLGPRQRQRGPRSIEARAKRAARHQPHQRQAEQTGQD